MNTHHISEASNPNAAASTLRSLYNSGDPAIHAAIAANPNTPLDILLPLAGSFPAAFCSNPVLPLLLLEQPNLPAHMPPDTLRRLLSYAGVPAAILRWIVAHAPPAEAETARLHINLAGEAGSDWAELARQACWHTTPPSYNDLLLELIVLGAIPAWLYEMLATVQDAEVRRTIAQSPHIPRSILRPLRHAGASGNLQGYVPAPQPYDTQILSRLAKGNVYARRVAARNPGSSAALLAQLAADSDSSVRQGVAANRTTDPKLLARLATDRSIDVRQLVARHSRMPQVLERLARDPARTVRINVARNPASAANILERLSADKEHTVRLALARNPNLAQDMLQTLARDSHPKVRAIAIRRMLALDLDIGEEARASLTLNQAQPASSHVTMPTIAQNTEHYAADPDTPLDELRRLAEDPNPRIRMTVGCNPATPPDLLVWLADDESNIVHQGVAQHPDVAPEILERFAADHTWANYRTRMAVARHPKVTTRALEIMADDMGVGVRRLVLANPRTPASALSKILARSLDMCLVSSEPFYHAIALAHPKVPLAAFERVAQSPDWLSRFAAAQNPHAPQALLEQLSQDGNRLVRAAARDGLLQAQAAHPSTDDKDAPEGLTRYSVGLDQTTPGKRLADFDSDPMLRAAREAMKKDEE